MGPGVVPLDDELAVVRGELTPRLPEGLVRLSRQIAAFAKAARAFAVWTPIALHRTSAARISAAAGAPAVALQTQAAEPILHTHPPAPPGPAHLVVRVAGALVPLRHGVWAAVRTRAVGEPGLRTTAAGKRVVATRARAYFSRVTDSASFGELATLARHRRGIETAQPVGAVADGAEGCQTFIDRHAPAARRILDFPHAAGYVAAIGPTSGPAGALLAAATRRS